MADVDGKVPPSQPLRTPTQFPTLVTNVDHAPSYSVDAVEAIHLGAMGHHLVAYAQLRHGGKAGRLHQDASTAKPAPMMAIRRWGFKSGAAR